MSQCCSPVNKEELFNLHHACARNVIERIFGVLKKRFQILVILPDYEMGLQACIPPALAAIHNFIQHHDPAKIDEYHEFRQRMMESEPGEWAHVEGVLATEIPGMAERNQANMRRDQMASAMWAQYQQELEQQAAE